MLSDLEVTGYCQKLGLASQAQAVLAAIRAAPPTRRVGSNGKNAPARYASHKMGVTIQAESYKNELAGVVEMERDDNVYEFYDQPPKITLRYEAKNGRKIGVEYTPDYFVIRKDRLGWEEWKTEEDLIRLSEEQPNRYVRAEDGTWRCPPGEEVAVPLGFYFKIRSSAEINWIFQRNMRFLEDYFREECPSVTEAAHAHIISLIQEEPGIRLDELLTRLEEATSDDLYILITTEQVYVDLYAVPLAERDRVHLFLDKETAQSWAAMLAEDSPIDRSGPHTVLVEPDAPILWDERPWTIANTGATTISLLSEDHKLLELPNERFHALIVLGRIVGVKAVPERGSLSKKAREQLNLATRAEKKVAVGRYKAIKPILDGLESTDNTSAGRAKRRWVAAYHDAERLYGYGFIGLLPKYHNCGRYGERLTEDEQKTVNKFIKEEYEHHKQKTKREVYGEFYNYCQANGMPTPPSYKTFVALVLRRPRKEQVEKREGPRAANAYEPPHWELTWTLPRHGDRPWEIVHIDHTQLDVELVDSKTGKNLGRPWATFMADAYSRRLLAAYLTFDRPSYKSCMMVIRECVRRHNRLPQLLIVDWGKEFESIDFEVLLGKYHCTKISRPTGKPDFAAVCERLFGTSNTTFVHNLEGNTQVTKNVRQVTQSVNPRKHAAWTLERLYARLREWAYEVYDTNEHEGIGQTPREAFIDGLLKGGVRNHTVVLYDDDFIYDTLPTPRKGTAMLTTDGVKINRIRYYAKGGVFNDHPELLKKQLEVCYDPYNIGHAYAKIAGDWKECVSEYNAQLEGRSEKEVQLISEELRRQKSRHGQQFNFTAAKLAAFVTSLDEEGELLLQRRRDAEAQSILSLINPPSHAPQTQSSQRMQTLAKGSKSAAATATATLPRINIDLFADDVLCEDY